MQPQDHHHQLVAVLGLPKRFTFLQGRHCCCAQAWAVSHHCRCISPCHLMQLEVLCMAVMHVVTFACWAADGSSTVMMEPGCSACSRTRMAPSIALWPASCHWAQAASSGSHPSHLKVGLSERRGLPRPHGLSLLPPKVPRLAAACLNAAQAVTQPAKACSRLCLAEGAGRPCGRIRLCFPEGGCRPRPP